MALLSVILSLLELYFCAVDYTKTANKGLRNVIYYGDWSVWGGQHNFYPVNIPGDALTHLNFAFLDFDASGGLVFTDPDAEYGNPIGVPGVSWGDANAGVLPAFQELRAKNPNLRLGVSLGGWSKSGDFTAVCSDASKLKNFVDQVGRFVEYNNFDFVDVDWEYPGSQREADLCDNKNDEGTPRAVPQDGKYFIDLLWALKDKLNELGKTNNRIYELTAALPAAIGNIENGAQAYLPSGVTKATATAAQMQEASTTYVTEMFEVLDFGNLMTYDLRGAWDHVSGHHTGLYTHLSGNAETDAVGFSADLLVSYLLGKTVDSKGNRLEKTIVQGVDPAKLVIGCAFYSRGWAKVSNDGPEPTQNPGLFGTAAIAGTDADQTPTPGAANSVPITMGDEGRLGGVWPYGELNNMKAAFPGLKYYYDEVAEAPYFYAEGGAFLSYDSPRSIKAKTDYVLKNKLGGIITWMVSEDASTGDEENGSQGTGVRGVLSHLIKEGLWGATPLEQFNIGAPSMNVSCTVAASGTSLTITIKNNFQTKESNAALVLAEKCAGSLIAPKIFITVKSGVSVAGGSSYGSGTWSQTGNVIEIHFTEYDLKTIAPGVSVSTAMTASGTVSAADVEKVEISRQIYPDGEEVGRAVIYP